MAKLIITTSSDGGYTNVNVELEEAESMSFVEAILLAVIRKGVQAMLEKLRDTADDITHAKSN